VCSWIGRHTHGGTRPRARPTVFPARAAIEIARCTAVA